MGGVEMALEFALLLLLGAGSLQAIRLRRALGAVREDRAAMAEAVEGFDTGARHAQAGLERMREAAEGLASQLDQAIALRDDLLFLSDRGELLADRLDGLVRAGRGLEASGAAGLRAAAVEVPVVRSRAERELQQAMRRRR